MIRDLVVVNKTNNMWCQKLLKQINRISDAMSTLHFLVAIVDFDV